MNPKAAVAMIAAVMLVAYVILVIDPSSPPSSPTAVTRLEPPDLVGKGPPAWPAPDSPWSPSGKQNPLSWSEVAERQQPDSPFAPTRRNLASSPCQSDSGESTVARTGSLASLHQICDLSAWCGCLRLHHLNLRSADSEGFLGERRQLQLREALNYFGSGNYDGLQRTASRFDSVTLDVSPVLFLKILQLIGDIDRGAILSCDAGEPTANRHASRLNCVPWSE